jgi:hypothetical protein
MARLSNRNLPFFEVSDISDIILDKGPLEYDRVASQKCLESE